MNFKRDPRGIANRSSRHEPIFISLAFTRPRERSLIDQSNRISDDLPGTPTDTSIRIARTLTSSRVYECWTSLRAVLRLFVSLDVSRNQRGHKRICTHYTPSFFLSLSLSLSSYARQYRSDIRETKRDDGARRTFAGEERHQAVPKSWAAVVGLMVHVLFFSRATCQRSVIAPLHGSRALQSSSSCSDVSPR